MPRGDYPQILDRLIATRMYDGVFGFILSCESTDDNDKFNVKTDFAFYTDRLMDAIDNEHDYVSTIYSRQVNIDLVCSVLDIFSCAVCDGCDMGIDVTLGDIRFDLFMFFGVPLERRDKSVIEIEASFTNTQTNICTEHCDISIDTDNVQIKNKSNYTIYTVKTRALI